ncbi:MAG: hypothetical protein IJ828_01005, partial [Treponema sp.]|nr:hypothetical protein [Treponema sp.]
SDSDSALEKRTALADLAAGDRVRHTILGIGTVVEVDDAKKQYTIAFDGMATPRKLSFKAPLKKC